MHALGWEDDPREDGPSPHRSVPCTVSPSDVIARQSERRGDAAGCSRVGAAAGNMLTGDWWSGSGNLIAAASFAGLWWRGERDRRSGGPAWLREAMAADARKRAAARKRDQDGTAA